MNVFTTIIPLHRTVRFLVMSLALGLGTSFGSLADEPEPLSLSLSDAVKQGLLQNQQVTDRLIAYRQAAVQWVAVQGVYSSELTASAYYADSELSPATSPINSAAEILHGEAGIRRQFSSGTQVGLDVNTDNVLFPGSPFASENNQTALTLSLRQPLLRNAWGAETEAAVAAARAQYDAAWQAYLDARDSVAFEIHRLYWTAYGGFSTWEVLQSSLDRAESLLEINRKRERDGVIEETDVLDAEASLAIQTVEVLAQQDRFVQSRESLFGAIQLPLEDWDRARLDFLRSLESVDFERQTDVWELYGSARSHREDFKALSYQLDAADAAVEEARQALKPELNLFGEYQVGNNDESWGQSVGTDKSSWTVGIEFRRAWDRSVEKSALRNAELEKMRTESLITQAEQNLMLAVRRSVRDLITLEARLEAAARAQQLNRRKLELEQEKYRQGRSDSRRIIDFQDDLKQAEGLEVQAFAQRLIRSAEQARLLGQLAPEVALRPEPFSGDAP